MEDAEEGKPFLSGEHTTLKVIQDARSLKRRLLDWIWVVSTVIFAILSVFLFFRSTRVNTYEHGFSTDLGMTTALDTGAPSNRPEANRKA
jgi:hypothetical protein